ncbi:hypothetical protein [Prevotella koreensis]
MRYIGEFRNVNNDLIKVQITTNNETTPIKEIIKENGLWFSSDPVQIEINVEDTFEHLIRKSCTINLITSDYVGTDLFADNARSVKVEIFNNDVCFFYGFLEPNTFSQPFAKPMEEFTLNCVDCLSTLQYYKYNNITLTNFDDKKTAANVVTFKDIFDKIFNKNNGIDGSIFYDMSKGIMEERTKNIFSDLAISEQYLIGDDYDDTWTYEDVLNEILKYLNLHIIQEGYNYFIFDWDSIKNKTWLNLSNNTLHTENPIEINLTSKMHAADDTTITISDVYNQIAVKDKLEKIENIIESPLDSVSLISLYNGKQLYMTEYISEGSGDRAHDAMVNMINGRPTTYKNASEIDWYIQAMNNKNWKFYLPSGKTLVDSLAEHNGDRYINQWKIAKYLKDNQLVPYIFKLGSVERKTKANDNSPTSKINMNNYMYISINGNEDDNENAQSPTDEILSNSQPIMEYIANNSGGVFSPSDEETTNYLVFSGKILLQPIVYESSSTVAKRTNGFEDILKNGMRKTEGSIAQVPHYDPIIDLPILGKNNLVKSDNNNEGRYYVRKFWTQVNPSDTLSSYLNDGSCGLQPWTKDKSAHGYKFNYSAKGDGSDKFSKVPILECELIIGNKRLIESNIDEFGNSKFQWVKIGQEPYESYVDSDGTTKTYQLKTFSLGFNPKIGDHIIGDEFDIQNTINYTMNVDAEGTAVPIKKSDALSGAVIFRILGPINCLWNNITRRHPTFFRHTKWFKNSRFILAHTENIIIKDFECKIYSDNGKYENSNNNDLIYMSDETDKFLNKKDDIEFKFITQLSASECAEKDISSSINMNAIIDKTTDNPLSTIYNARTKTTAKPEELYVDQYYREFATPKIMMTATMHNSNKIKLYNLYNSSVLNKKFFIQSMNFDVRMNKKEITFKEI